MERAAIFVFGRPGSWPLRRLSGVPVSGAAPGLEPPPWVLSGRRERGRPLRGAGFSLRRLLFWSRGARAQASALVAHQPRCSVACGIFPDHGSNPALQGTCVTTRLSEKPQAVFLCHHHLLCTWGILVHDSAFDRRFSNLSLLQHHLEDFTQMMAEPTQGSGFSRCQGGRGLRTCAAPELPGGAEVTGLGTWRTTSLGG